MTTAKTYKDKLLDPRWQKKRLEVLQRDEWRCQACLNDEDTLHIHHMFYPKGKEPWEIDSRFLVTLCSDCHDIAGISPVTDSEYPYSIDTMFLCQEIDYLEAMLSLEIKEMGRSPRELFQILIKAIGGRN